MNEQHILPTYARFPITLTRGEGSYVWDDRGHRYLDFCSGIAVCSLGHSHPKLLAAIREQAEQLIHVSNLYHTLPAQALADLLVEQIVQLPGKVFFANSGAEANDGLIKLARRFGQLNPDPRGAARHEIITCTSSFHGRTIGSMTATGQEKIHSGFGPLLPGFRYVPFNDLNAFREAVSPQTAAVLIEPIQGEGGVRIASAEYLRGLRRICNSSNTLLMFDEVQCGLGRAGNLNGWRAIAPEVKPDAISWAKGLGGGFPISAFWVSDFTIEGGEVPLCEVLQPGSHGSTYGGNPLACHTSQAVLREILSEDLATHAQEEGAYLREQMMSWKHPAIAEVRGLGLLIGLGLRTSHLDLARGQVASAWVCGQLMERGLLCPPAGPETVRLLPPLTVSREETDCALSILRETLDQISTDVGLSS